MPEKIDITEPSMEESSSSDRIDDLDAELDSFDDFDIDANMESTPKDERSPITDFSLGVAKGALIPSSITLDNISSEIDRYMPEVGSALSNVTQVTSTLDMYRFEALQEIQPTINKAKLVGKRVLDRYGKYVPERIRTRLSSLFELPEEQAAKSKEDERDELIQQSLIKLQQTQLKTFEEQQVAQEAQEFMRQQLETLRHKDQQTLLARISRATDTTYGFLNSTLRNYLVKSLELKYRVVFLLQDIKKFSNVTAEAVVHKLEAIKHNTGLPDVVKIHKTEEFSQKLRERLYGKVGDKLNEWRGNFLSKTLDNIKTNIFDKFTENINTYVGGTLEDINMMLEMNEEFAEFDDESDATKAGKSGGGFIQRQVIKRLAKYLQKNNVESVTNLNELVEDLSASLPTIITDKIKGSDSSILQWISENILPEREEERGGISKKLKETADLAIPFDVLTKRAITDIIPGYLAKILAQVTGISSKIGASPSDELVYDIEEEDYISSKQLSKDIKSRIKGTLSQRTNRVKPLFEHLAKAYLEKEDASPSILEGQTNNLIRFFVNITKHDKNVNLKTMQKIVNNEELTPSEERDVEWMFEGIDPVDKETIAKLFVVAYSPEVPTVEGATEEEDLTLGKTKFQQLIDEGKDALFNKKGILNFNAVRVRAANDVDQHFDELEAVQRLNQTRFIKDLFGAKSEEDIEKYREEKLKEILEKDEDRVGKRLTKKEEEELETEVREYATKRSLDHGKLREYMEDVDLDELKNLINDIKLNLDDIRDTSDEDIEVSEETAETVAEEESNTRVHDTPGITEVLDTPKVSTSRPKILGPGMHYYQGTERELHAPLDSSKGAKSFWKSLVGYISKRVDDYQEEREWHKFDNQFVNRRIVEQSETEEEKKDKKLKDVMFNYFSTKVQDIKNQISKKRTPKTIIKTGFNRYANVEDEISLLQIIASNTRDLVLTQPSIAGMLSGINTTMLSTLSPDQLKALGPNIKYLQESSDDIWDILAKGGIKIGTSALSGMFNVQKKVWSTIGSTASGTLNLAKKILPSTLSGSKGILNVGKDLVLGLTNQYFGFLNSAMTPIKSLLGQTSNIKNFIFKGRRKIGNFPDIYRKDNIELGKPLCPGKWIENGRAVLASNQKQIDDIYDIDGPVIDKTNGRVLITEEDIKIGLCDFQGKEITAKVKYKSHFQSVLSGVGKLFKGGYKLAKSASLGLAGLSGSTLTFLTGFVKNLFPTTMFSNLREILFGKEGGTFLGFSSSVKTRLDRIIQINSAILTHLGGTIPEPITTQLKTEDNSDNGIVTTTKNTVNKTKNRINDMINTSVMKKFPSKRDWYDEKNFDQSFVNRHIQEQTSSNNSLSLLGGIKKKISNIGTKIREGSYKDFLRDEKQEEEQETQEQIRADIHDMARVLTGDPSINNKLKANMKKGGKFFGGLLGGFGFTNIFSKKDKNIKNEGDDPTTNKEEDNILPDDPIGGYLTNMVISGIAKKIPFVRKIVEKIGSSKFGQSKFGKLLGSALKFTGLDFSTNADAAKKVTENAKSVSKSSKLLNFGKDLFSKTKGLFKPSILKNFITKAAQSKTKTGAIVAGIAGLTYGLSKLFSSRGYDKDTFGGYFDTLRLNYYGFPKSDNSDYREIMYEIEEAVWNSSTGDELDIDLDNIRSWTKTFGLDPEDENQVEYIQGWFQYRALPIAKALVITLKSFQLDEPDEYIKVPVPSQKLFVEKFTNIANMLIKNSKSRYGELSPTKKGYEQHKVRGRASSTKSVLHKSTSQIEQVKKDTKGILGKTAETAWEAFEIGSTIGLGMSAVGAVTGAGFSAAAGAAFIVSNPVGWAVGAGLLAYGAYNAIKYLNKATPIEKYLYNMRMKLYSVDFEYLDTITDMEEEVWETFLKKEPLVWSKDQYVEWASDLGLVETGWFGGYDETPEFNKLLNYFKDWFNLRFLPVCLAYGMALKQFEIDDIDDGDDLKQEQLKDFTKLFIDKVNKAESFKSKIYLQYIPTIEGYKSYLKNKEKTKSDKKTNAPLNVKPEDLTSDKSPKKKQRDLYNQTLKSFIGTKVNKESSPSLSSSHLSSKATNTDFKRVVKSSGIVKEDYDKIISHEKLDNVNIDLGNIEDFLEKLFPNSSKLPDDFNQWLFGAIHGFTKVINKIRAKNNKSSISYHWIVMMVYSWITQESNFDISAHSNTGDFGILQVNWRWQHKAYGLSSPSELLDPKLNISIAFDIFKKQFIRYEGNIQNALHAYNAGNIDNPPGLRYAKAILKRTAKYIAKARKLKNNFDELTNLGLHLDSTDEKSKNIKSGNKLKLVASKKTGSTQLTDSEKESHKELSSEKRYQARYMARLRKKYEKKFKNRRMEVIAALKESSNKTLMGRDSEIHINKKQQLIDITTKQPVTPEKKQRLAFQTAKKTLQQSIQKKREQAQQTILNKTPESISVKEIAKTIIKEQPSVIKEQNEKSLQLLESHLQVAQDQLHVLTSIEDKVDILTQPIIQQQEKKKHQNKLTHDESSIQDLLKNLITVNTQLVQALNTQIQQQDKTSTRKSETQQQVRILEESTKKLNTNWELASNNDW